VDIRANCRLRRPGSARLLSEEEFAAQWDRLVTLIRDYHAAAIRNRYMALYRSTVIELRLMCYEGSMDHSLTLHLNRRST
jgi:hypothetical protein